MRIKYKILGGSLKGRKVCVRNFEVRIKETWWGVQTVPVAGSCEHGNDPTCSINAGNVISS